MANLNDRIDSLERMVNFGLSSGKKNVIADLDVLYCLFEQLAMTRQALVPFAAAASRPGRLTDGMETTAHTTTAKG